MFDIQHDGFVARLSVAGDLIRGEVLDLHEYLIIEGQSIPEVRKDFASKMESYCLRCKQRGIPLFSNPDGKSTVEWHAEFAAASPRLKFDPLSEWPHNHRLFFGTKASMMLEQMVFLQKSSFRKIPLKLRLPIDDTVDVLRERKRSPSLADEWRTPQGGKNLLPWLRLFLYRAFRRVSAADPRNRELERDYAVRFLTDARRLDAEGTNFLNQYGGVDGFPRFSDGLNGKESYEHFKIVTELEIYIGWSLERLSMMMSWAHAGWENLAPEQGGRPRLTWKHDFVAAIAELWELLTPKQPSRDGPFADLVDAAWRSGGDDMPAVEWGETIRKFCRSWNKDEKGGKTPHARG
jgi:hypothetical protein